MCVGGVRGVDAVGQKKRWKWKPEEPADDTKRVTSLGLGDWVENAAPSQKDVLVLIRERSVAVRSESREVSNSHIGISQSHSLIIFLEPPRSAA